MIGTDKNLFKNLETFFTTHYHQFELLFCFNSSDDAAVQVVESLIRKYPQTDVKLFFSKRIEFEKIQITILSEGETVGLNPKINNMMPAYQAARYPLIMISDSAIYMKPEGILDMATTIMTDPKMALVTQTPYCKDRKGIDAEFEQVLVLQKSLRIVVFKVEDMRIIQKKPVTFYQSTKKAVPTILNHMIVLITLLSASVHSRCTLERLTGESTCLETAWSSFAPQECRQ